MAYPAKFLSAAFSTFSVKPCTDFCKQTSMIFEVIWKKCTIFVHCSLSSLKTTIPFLRVSLIFSKSTFFISRTAVSAMNSRSSLLVSFNLSQAEKIVWWPQTWGLLRISDFKLVVQCLDIVACQRGGVSNKPPGLQAATIHGARDPNLVIATYKKFKKERTVH